MLAKQTKMSRTNREQILYLSKKSSSLKRVSATVGLMMALKDPKVSIMAVMCCSQLLGLGFVNFFPTCVNYTLNTTSDSDINASQYCRHDGILDNRHSSSLRVSDPNRMKLLDLIGFSDLLGFSRLLCALRTHTALVCSSTSL